MYQLLNGISSTITSNFQYQQLPGPAGTAERRPQGCLGLAGLWLTIGYDPPSNRTRRQHKKLIGELSIHARQLLRLL